MEPTMHRPRKRLTANSLKVALFLAAGILAPRAAYAVGEVNGRISGTITEAVSGAPVPGASVTVSGSALIGGPRTQTSSDDGHYEFVELPQGRYDVEVSYSGVKPIKRRVVVRQGETVPLDIQWSPELAQAEVTVVVEERHMTKPDSTQTGTVLTLDQESRVASGRSYQSIALQVAGVNDINGGRNPQIKGGTYIMNRYLVDGLDITDPVTNTFSANINFDSISSVEVLTGGMEAEYNSLGGVINLITAGGSDEWHVDSSLYINNTAFSAGNQYGPNLYNGVRDWFVGNRPPQQQYNANMNVGGPILKHRLWFNLSLEYGYRERSIPAGPPLNIQEPPTTSHRILVRGKLTWAPNEKHRITLSISGDPAYFNYVDQDNARLPIAEDFQGQGGAFAILQWDYFKSQNLNTNVQMGFQYSNIYTGPQGYGLTGSSGLSIGDESSMFGPKNKMYDPNAVQHNNQADSTTWYQGGAITSNARWTFQLDPSISIRGNGAGYHDAKVGIQYRYAQFNYDVEIPGKDFDGTLGRVYNDQDSMGSAGEAGLCNPATGAGGCFQRSTSPKYSQVLRGHNLGLYLQDRWHPVKRLTVVPGLRFDYGISTNTAGKSSNLWGFGPRLGVIVDITGNQKTMFKAFYGRSNETMSLLTVSSADATPVNTVEQYNPMSPMPPTQRWEPLYSTGGAGGYRLNSHADAPHTDEITLSLNREIFHDSVAAIEYTYKRIGNIWDGVEMNQIWDPSGARVVGYVNGQPQQVFFYTTPDSNWRVYQGIDFSVESRPSPNWDIYAAYTLSWLYGPGAEELGQIGGSEVGNSGFYNPRQKQFYDGFLPEDTRHVLKLRASYVWHGLNLGATFNYMTGQPGTKTFFNQNDGGYTNRRSPSGTDPGATSSNARASLNDPTRWSEFRSPDVIQVNARLAYDFSELIKQHIILIFDFFNLFNLGAAQRPNGNGFPLQQENISSYGQVIGRQTPFQFQLGLRYLY
jgi:hypothetical protein